MTGIPGFVGFVVDEVDSSSLVRRQAGCLKCPDIAPDCPSCPEGQSCINYAQTCEHCASSTCQPMEGSSSSSSIAPPNTGAIAGGVIGGLFLVATLTYLLWRFCVKNKRASYAEQWQGEGDRTKEHTENDFASRRSQRESTHTVNSIASTVLTRASNIIQIAYIPGVTNRAAPTSPTLLVPPVPPIPIVHTDSATSSPYEDQHFFVPGALRDSTYSGISSYSDRTSYARTSYAPRSSVASTIYGKNVVVSPVPAQKGNFLKPSLVSVKTRAGSTTSDESAPPVPSVNLEKYENRPPPSPAFSIGSTFLKNASTSTATSIRPQIVRVGSGPKTVDIKGSSKSTSPLSSTTIAELECPDTPTHLLKGSSSSSQGGESAAVTPIDEGTPTNDQGPFSDPPRIKSDNKRNSSSLSAVIEESTRRASQINPYQRSANAVRGSSPFGDENAVRE